MRVWGGERENEFRQRWPLSRLRGKETKSGPEAGQSLSRLRRKRTMSGTETVSS